MQFVYIIHLFKLTFQMIFSVMKFLITTPSFPKCMKKVHKASDSVFCWRLKANIVLRPDFITCISLTSSTEHLSEYVNKMSFWCVKLNFNVLSSLRPYTSFCISCRKCNFKNTATQPLALSLKYTLLYHSPTRWYKIYIFKLSPPNNTRRS